MKHSNFCFCIIFPHHLYNRPILPKNKKSPAFHQKEDETLSRGTTSIHPYKTCTDLLSISPANKVPRKGSSVATIPAFLLFFHSPISSAITGGPVRTYLPAANRIFRLMHKSSSSLPLQSHLPSVFPHFLSANHVPNMPLYGAMAGYDRKFLCKVPIDVLSFSACFCFFLFSD